MVDSQSCSGGNQTRLDGTGDEKKGEVMSFSDRRSGGDVIWWSVIGLIFIAGQVEILLSWEIRTSLASGSLPSSIATSPPCFDHHLCQALEIAWNLKN